MQTRAPVYFRTAALCFRYFFYENTGIKAGVTVSSWVFDGFPDSVPLLGLHSTDGPCIVTGGFMRLLGFRGTQSHHIVDGKKLGSRGSGFLFPTRSFPDVPTSPPSVDNSFMICE